MPARRAEPETPTAPPTGLLPQPLHFFRSLTGGLHYHFGLFSPRDVDLPAALDTLTQLVVGALPPAPRRVLDVGCGLGGTTRLLDRCGHDVTGLDPCAAAVAQGRRTRGGPRWLVTTFEAFARSAPPGAYDALVMLEVLHHLPPPHELMTLCERLVGPDGRVVVADVLATDGAARPGVPFVARGELTRSVPRAGLEVVGLHDVTAAVSCTPARLLEALVGERERLLREHASRPGVADEWDELVAQCRLLREGFEHGRLCYEVAVLRRPPGRAG